MHKILFVLAVVAIAGCASDHDGDESEQSGGSNDDNDGAAGSGSNEDPNDEAAAGTGSDSGGAGNDAAGEGAAGKDAIPEAGMGAAGAAGDDSHAGNDEVPPGGVPYAMDQCGLDTGYPGDEYCILPPPPDKGFQVHIGPDDYDNVDPRYILAAGQESTDDFPAMAGNTEDRHFLFRQFRMRPGAHHMIATETAAMGGTFGGRRIATANLSGDSPVHGIVAPENEGVGVPIPANARINISLHSINVTTEPILREIWVNFWYREPGTVSEEATQLFQVGDPSFEIQPGADTILGPYSCDIQGEGRMLWFYGHRHANNKRFSAWRVRGAERLLFYEGFHWEDVLTLEYNSLITNPVAVREDRVEGGHTGVLDLRPGDKLEWECHVINEQATPLRFSNETYLGEMCIMDAELVGATCSGGAPGGFGM